MLVAHRWVRSGIDNCISYVFRNDFLSNWSKTKQTSLSIFSPHNRIRDFWPIRKDCKEMVSGNDSTTKTNNNLNMSHRGYWTIGCGEGYNLISDVSGNVLVLLQDKQHHLYEPQIGGSEYRTIGEMLQPPSSHSQLASTKREKNIKSLSWHNKVKIQQNPLNKII